MVDAFELKCSEKDFNKQKKINVETKRTLK